MNKRSLALFALIGLTAAPIDAARSQDLIDELSEIYADDQAEIAALTGVEFIAA